MFDIISTSYKGKIPSFITAFARIETGKIDDKIESDRNEKLLEYLECTSPVNNKKNDDNIERDDLFKKSSKEFKISINKQSNQNYNLIYCKSIEEIKKNLNSKIDIIFIKNKIKFTRKILNSIFEKKIFLLLDIFDNFFIFNLMKLNFFRFRKNLIFCTLAEKMNDFRKEDEIRIIFKSLGVRRICRENWVSNWKRFFFVMMGKKNGKVDGGLVGIIRNNRIIPE